jgi:hypothetical protein
MYFDMRARLLRLRLDRPPKNSFATSALLLIDFNPVPAASSRRWVNPESCTNHASLRPTPWLGRQDSKHCIPNDRHQTPALQQKGRGAQAGAMIGPFMGSSV